MWFQLITVAMFINERKVYLMSAKSQIINMLEFMGENEANQILQYVRNTFSLKPRTWDDIEEDIPSPDETAIFEEYYANK